jgi:hypothetical protein
MRINPQINQVLTEFGIPVNDGVAYLLSIHFDCRPSYTPPNLIQRINVTNILGISSKKELLWNVPLFADENADEKWHWVIAWNKSFKDLNSKRTAPDKDVIKRMKAFFADNPDVRKEEVIGGTKLYFSSLNSAEYLTSSHYFISKGVGRDRVSNLELWVNRYKEIMSNTSLGEETDITSVMQ